MKNVIVLILLFPLIASAQKPTTTFAFEVKGEVKTNVTITWKDLLKYKEHTIGDVTITNHLGEKKSNATGLKGVLVKDVLSTIEITSPSPKQLSEYYLVCKATDGYTAVYSWNELFNSPTGEAVYFVTQKEGKPASELADAILMISPTDFKTGRRYLKSLTSITIYRAP